MTAFRDDGDDALLDVLVSPRASRDRVGPMHGGRLKLAVTAPPVDGEANRAVVDALARALARSRRDVDVVAGHGSRRKTVRVRGMTAAQVRERLA